MCELSLERQLKSNTYGKADSSIDRSPAVQLQVARLDVEGKVGDIKQTWSVKLACWIICYRSIGAYYYIKLILVHKISTIQLICTVTNSTAQHKVRTCTYTVLYYTRHSLPDSWWTFWASLNYCRETNFNSQFNKL